jgi:hypothetical protein
MMDHEQMPSRLRVRTTNRQFEVDGTSERLEIGVRDHPSTLRSSLKATEHYAKDCSLQLVKTRVHTNQFGVRSCPPTILAQETHAVSDLRVSARHCPSITHRTEVLGWIEAERCCFSQRPYRLSPIEGTMRLSRIFHHRDPCALSHPSQAVNISRLSEEVDGDQRSSPWTYRGGSGIWIHAVAKCLDVDSDRDGSDLADRHPGSDRRHGWDKDFVAGLHAYGTQCQRERVRAATYSNGVRDAALSAPLTLECLDLRAQNVVSSLEHSVKGCQQLRMSGKKRGPRIGEGN